MAKQVTGKEDEYRALLDELLSEHLETEVHDRRRKNSSSRIKASALRKTLSKKQVRLAQEKHRYVSILCPRRSGKSYAILVAAIADCVEFTGYRVAIFCLSKPHAKGIYWEDVKSLNERHGLDIKFNGTELVCRFPNGSLLVFCGAESDAEISKVRGRKYNRVVIDESTVYNRKIYHDLLHLVVGPALADLKGSLWIAGTPAGEHSGDFFEATCTPPQEITQDDGSIIQSNWDINQPEPVNAWRWKFHTWTAQDNTAVPFLWEEFLEKKRFNGWKDDNPTWRQEYLGEWVKLDHAAVFKIRRYAHTYDGPLPWADGRLNKCHFILGADFGYHDGTAIVVWCFVEDEPYIYEVTSVKKRGITEQEIADMITRTEGLLPKRVRFRVGDPAGGGVLIMEGLKRTYGLAFETAEKHNKVDYINQFNLALDSGLVRFRPGSVLLEEMEAIQWEESTYGTSRQKEDRAYPNDLADGALYAFRFAKNRFIEVPPVVGHPVQWSADAEKEEYCRRRDAQLMRTRRLDPYGRLKRRF